MINAVRQQAITLASVDPDPYHRMMSIGHNELGISTSLSRMWSDRMLIIY